MKTYFYIFLYFFLLGLILGFTGCVSPIVTEQKANVYYSKSIKFDVESTAGKFSFVGSGVIEQSGKLKITVYPSGNADLISVSSCHREMRLEDPDKKFFDKGYSFELDPIDGLESGRSCPIEIGVYDKKKGKNAWGYLAVKNKKYQMAANVKCNGSVKDQVGTSVCQSRSGLIQEYYFKDIVEPVFTPQCKIASGPGQRFTFPLPSGPCTVYFIDVLNSQNLHQANLFGYDEVLLKD